MKEDFREMFSRLLSSGMFILLGIGLGWRGYSFVSPLDPSILTPVLCIALGMVLVITGITVAMRGGEFELDTPRVEPEVQPYSN